MVIYVDVLLLVNLYMNYFILKSASAVLHIKLGQMRAVFSSFVGSLSAFSVFLEDKPILFATTKLAVVFLITVFAFGREGLIKNVFVTFFMTAVFGGIIYGISELFNTRIKVINGNFYADISIPFLAAATIIAYAVIRIAGYITDIAKIKGKSASISVSIGSRQRTFLALIDSGNLVTDYVSGRPVIICPYEEIKDLLTDGCKTRLMPYTTVNSQGLLTLITPDEVVLCYGNRKKRIDVLIGCDSKYATDRAIVNPKLLV